MAARRIIAGAALALIGAVLLAVTLYVRALTPQLELGVGYAARVACGCRFIEARPLAQCRDDFEAGMEPIRLAENASTRTVTASVPLIAHRSAHLDPVLGCQPEAFGGAARGGRR